GGHTELTSRYDYPVIVGTMLGPTRYCYDAGQVRVDDVVLMTKHAGMEGMSILADDRPDLLSFLTDQERKEVRGWKSSLSVIPEAALIRDLALYMHDPTEGGLWGGITELEHVCDRSIHVNREKVCLSDLTRRAAQELGFDPCRLISSGVLLSILPGNQVQEALKRLEEAQIPAAVIGKIIGKMEERSGGGEEGTVGYRSGGDKASKEELWRLLKLP
ncbi:MAG: AIR synthase-related protein, partial [Peptococcaceae bacterium]|nr:AIR synthase-related protein [Peptococcaceae bacterium]